MGIQNNLQEILFRVGFLLAAALLLWPKSMLLDPLPLVVALGFASIIAVVASVLLNPMIQLLSWLDEEQSQTEIDTNTTSVRAAEFMRKDFPSLSLDTPVENIPAVISAGGASCVLIMDQVGKLAGIITEADLFVKEEKLPRTDVTYLALFQQPVQPEFILKSYNSFRGRYRASEIMSQPVITIKGDRPISQAIHLIVKHGYKIIPVLDNSGEHVIGILTRTDLIRHFLGSTDVPGEKSPSQSPAG
jgi:CBS domain-containing protein